MLCGTDMRRLLPPLTGLVMLAALAIVFLVVPTEADMGIVQRIFYFHVSSAWVAFLGFFLVAAASAVYLWNGSPAADRLAYAAAEVGVLFCTLVLILLAAWFVDLRVRGARLEEEVAALRRELDARRGEVA